MTFQEKVHCFGREQHLVGISTVHSDSSTSKFMSGKKIGFILVNAAAVHKVGPFRMSVEVARLIAKEGCLTFRYDHCGLGDSRKLKASRSYDDHVMADFSDAVSFLETEFSLKHFIVFGLCTGADLAFKTVVSNKCVVGAVLLDGYGYPTKRYYWDQVRKYYLEPKRICFFLWRLLQRRPLAQNVQRPENEFLWKMPTKTAFIADMNAIYQRQPMFRALFCYTGDVNYISYDGQLEESFAEQPWVTSIKSVRFPRADHTYVLKKDRLLLSEVIRSWLDESFVLEG